MTKNIAVTDALHKKLDGKREGKPFGVLIESLLEAERKNKENELLRESILDISKIAEHNYKLLKEHLGEHNKGGKVLVRQNQ